MKALRVSVTGSNGADSCVELLPSLSAPRVALRDALDFSTAARQRGMARWLLACDADSLHRELCRSGRAMLATLDRVDPAEIGASRLLPFFDAVAAGDWDAARGVGARAPVTWNEEEEYEDDFLWVRFLIELVVSGGSTDARLAAWENIADTEKDPRFALALALRDRSAPAFDAALGDRLEAERARLARLSARGALDPDFDATERHISIEGLALVRIARIFGVPTLAEYAGVPATALGDRPPAFSDDGRRSI